MIFSGRDGLKAFKNHALRIGIARPFLLVSTGKGISLHAGEQLFHFLVAELRALDTGRRTHALNGGNALEAGELFRRKRLNHLPAAFKLIDFSDELQNLWGNGDVLDVMHRRYPFIPIYTQFTATKQADIHSYPFISNYCFRSL